MEMMGRFPTTWTWTISLLGVKLGTCMLWQLTNSKEPMQSSKTTAVRCWGTHPPPDFLQLSHVIELTLPLMVMVVLTHLHG
jgi:hypothetical protein